MIRAQHITLGTRLQDVSLRLSAGSLTAVVGPNGAGKSTLLCVLAGLLKAKGHIAWMGEDLDGLAFPERGRRLAWVGQDLHADFAFPVRDVVAQGRHAFGDDGEFVDTAMRAMDIAHLADRPVTRLSGGERRRVFLARALATNARIHLWDEPTANLDVRHGLDVLRLAATLRDQGCTVLISLHDLRAALFFDQVLVLDRGRLAAAGKPAEVLNPELIRQVFGVRARMGNEMVLELEEGAGPLGHVP